MNDDDGGFFTGRRLADCTVAVIGLGLMGGSLAMALRGHCKSLLGIDRDPAVKEPALNLGVVDHFTTDPAELLPQADLVILAAPVRSILRLLADLPRLIPGRAMILDLGSTKRQVASAMRNLPERFDPLGGHPMCGRERGSLAAAEPGLFGGKTFAFTALERTSPQSRRLAEELAQAIGARPLWLDPETHDRWTASSSHLPYLVSNILAGVTPLEAAPMIGTGFLSTSRLAVSPVEMMLDVVLTNREYILQAAERFHSRLDQVQAALQSGDETALRLILEEGSRQRDQITSLPAN